MTKIIGRVKYIGTDIGFDGMVNGKEYDVEWAEYGNYGVIDESGESYLYNAKRPANCMQKYADVEFGRFEIISDPSGLLKRELLKNVS